MHTTVVGFSTDYDVWIIIGREGPNKHTRNTNLQHQNSGDAAPRLLAHTLIIAQLHCIQWHKQQRCVWRGWGEGEEM